MTSALRALISDLVIANRALAHEGVLDGFGHVSVRHPDHPGRYFLPRARSPELIGIDDIVEFHLGGEPVTPLGDTPLYVERAIHGAIYAERPDVQAICHNHADSVIPFSVTGVPLRPMLHIAALIGERVPVWDIDEESGDATDLLVRTAEQGRSLARALAGGRTALMRGHGSVVAAGSLPDVVITAVYLDRNAKLQFAAQQLGNVKFLSPREVAGSAEVHTKPSIVGRAWEYWRARAGFGGI
jgi:ribulose-5-phosphate 4-epimerase/fuculose-1-phosphate aldolase